MGQVGDPKTTGTGSALTGTATVPTQSLEQRLHANSAEVLTEIAGPLATSAPWELVWHIDPEVSESVRQGEMGAAITQAILNPYTSLTAVGFAKEIGDKSLELIANHPEEFATLEEAWADTREALGSISGALGGFDMDELRQLEEGLEETLGDYERTYDGAQGADERSAQQLREAAARPTPPTEEFGGDQPAPFFDMYADDEAGSDSMDLGHLDFTDGDD